MIKGNLQHEHLRVRNACRKLSEAIDAKPDALRGITIEPRNVVIKHDFSVRNISIASILLAFFVKVFH